MQTQRVSSSSLRGIKRYILSAGKILTLTDGVNGTFIGKIDVEALFRSKILGLFGKNYRTVGIIAFKNTCHIDRYFWKKSDVGQLHNGVCRIFRTSIQNQFAVSGIPDMVYAGKFQRIDIFFSFRSGVNSTVPCQTVEFQAASAVQKGICCKFIAIKSKVWIVKQYRSAAGESFTHISAGILEFDGTACVSIKSATVKKRGGTALAEDECTVILDKILEVTTFCGSTGQLDFTVGKSEITIVYKHIIFEGSSLFAVKIEISSKRKIRFAVVEDDVTIAFIYGAQIEVFSIFNFNIQISAVCVFDRWLGINPAVVGDIHMKFAGIFDEEFLRFKIHKLFINTDLHFSGVGQDSLHFDIIIGIKTDRSAIYDLAVWGHGNICFGTEKIQQRTVVSELNGPVIFNYGIFQLQSGIILAVQNIVACHQTAGKEDRAVIYDFAAINDENRIFACFKINCAVIVKSSFDLQFAVDIQRGIFFIVESAFYNDFA